MNKLITDFIKLNVVYVIRIYIIIVYNLDKSIKKFKFLVEKKKWIYEYIWLHMTRRVEYD